MSRLASLTPSRGRSSLSPSPSPSQSSSPSQIQTQNQNIETTHHRMLKLVLREIKSSIKTWDELVIVDGFKAGKDCVDQATEMDNLLESPEVAERPLVSPHLESLIASRLALQAVLTKLEKCLTKIAILVDQAEKIFFEACKLQSLEFSLKEPLWLTWTLEHFTNTLSPLPSIHHAHLTILKILAEALMSPSTSFEDSKLTLERWRDISIGGERYEAVREWEELVEIELIGFAGEGGVGGEDEDGIGNFEVKRKKKGKK